MKGLYEQSVVAAAAPKALEYWKTRFEERKEAWIAEHAEKTVGMWWWKRKLGREDAERCFEAGIFVEGLPYHECGGAFWFEQGRIETAEYLVSLSRRPGTCNLILEQKEIATLYPAFEQMALEDLEWTAPN